MSYLYLLVNFFTVFIPLLFSFHPKIKFNLSWKSFFPASILVAIIFIIWDSIFTHLGVWYFNPDYILGIYFFKLPLEEILFFICIPFSCVFTYFCLDKFYNLKWNPKTEVTFCILFSTILLIAGIIHLDKLYTSVTFISTALACLILKFALKIDWLGKAVTVYAILLIPFLIVNGILTGTGIEGAVVNYNPTENLGIRILTIPIEDAFYGFEMILLNIYLFNWFEEKFNKKEIKTNS